MTFGCEIFKLSYTKFPAITLDWDSEELMFWDGKEPEQSAIPATWVLVPCCPAEWY